MNGVFPAMIKTKMRQQKMIAVQPTRRVCIQSVYFCSFHRSVIELALQPVQSDWCSIGGSISLSISHLLVAIVAITGHPLAPAATAAFRLAI